MMDTNNSTIAPNRSQIERHICSFSFWLFMSKS